MEFHEIDSQDIEINTKNCIKNCHSCISTCGLENRIEHLLNCLEVEGDINFDSGDIKVEEYPIDSRKGNEAHLLIKKEYKERKHLILSVPSIVREQEGFRCLRISYPSNLTLNPKNFNIYSKTLSRTYDGHDIEDDSHNQRVGALSYFLSKKLEDLFITNKQKNILESNFKKKYPRENFEELYEGLRNMFHMCIEKSTNQFTANYLEEIKHMSILHDIGKLLIPPQILNAPRALTKEEYRIVQRHAIYGKEILKDIKGLELAASIVEAHHEKWNAGGYPLGLKKEKIPTGSLITSIIDIYNALATNRPYRDAIDPSNIRLMTWGKYKSKQTGKTERRDNFMGHFHPIIDVFMYEVIYGEFVNYHKLITKYVHTN